MHSAVCRRKKDENDEILFGKGGNGVKMQTRPTKKHRQKKIQSFKVGDLVKIGDEVHFVDENMLGAVGMIISFNETGYPKGISGRSRDNIMYTVAAGGKNIKLFEDEMEFVQ